MLSHLKRVGFVKFGNFQDLEAVEPEEARDIERAMVEPKSTEKG